MREAAIEAYLNIQAQKHGALFLKWVSPGVTGVPDRILLLPGGRVIFTELKTDDGVLSPRQEYILQKLRDMGFDARVIKGKTEAEDLVNEIWNLNRTNTSSVPSTEF